MLFKVNRESGYTQLFEVIKEHSLALEGLSRLLRPFKFIHRYSRLFKIICNRSQGIQGHSEAFAGIQGYLWSFVFICRDCG
jgi:hypothetical protein